MCMRVCVHAGMCCTDGVLIGPYDLSLSLGFPAPAPDPHPEVEKVIQQILASSHAKNKKWCVSRHPSSSACFLLNGSYIDNINLT